MSGFNQPRPAGAPSLAVDAGYGYLLGLFPVNALHNIVHLAVGAVGVMAYRSFASARLYARSVAVVFALLTIPGLIPGLNTTFGLIPIFGAGFRPFPGEHRPILPDSPLVAAPWSQVRSCWPRSLTKGYTAAANVNPDRRVP